MDFGGQYLLDAAPEKVWEVLNDTDVLKAAIPGCDTIDWTGPGTLDLSIRVNLGMVKPTFAGALTLSNIVPARSYTLSGRGKGGILGLAEGAADIALHEHPEGTLLVFTARGGASGRIMKLGKAVIGNSAQRVIDGFFERLGHAGGLKVVPLGAPGGD